MSLHEYVTDWDNIDLERASERDKDILDSYNFETLLLEINCNLKKINRQTVREQFDKELRNKIKTAREVFESNLDNIVQKAKQERNS